MISHMRLSNYRSVADRGAAYLAGTSRSVGRGWPRRPLPTPNFNFGVGPGNDVQWILNIQPVAPVRIAENWNLINRPIIPVIYQPELETGAGSEFGLGDIQYQAYLSPAKPGKVISRAFPCCASTARFSCQGNGSSVALAVCVISVPSLP